MLQLKNVTFGYRKDTAVLTDFSMDLQGGGVYGLLGRNGCGKSTLLYLMSGLLHARSGEVTWMGKDVKERLPEVQGNMFLVPEEYDLPRIVLDDYVKVVRPFYPRFSDELLNQCLNDFGLSRDVQMGSLSMGQKKKVYVSVAMAANTHVLLMDEPTNGMDIPSKSQFRRAVSRCMSDEKLVVVSTHQVKDVELLLDHLCIVDQNRVLMQGSMEQVAERFCCWNVNRAPEQVPGAVYIEPSYQGFSVLAERSADSQETPVNLELFFDAMLTVPNLWK